MCPGRDKGEEVGFQVFINVVTSFKESGSAGAMRTLSGLFSISPSLHSKQSLKPWGTTWTSSDLGSEEFDINFPGFEEVGFLSLYLCFVNICA